MRPAPRRAPPHDVNTSSCWRRRRELLCIALSSEHETARDASMLPESRKEFREASRSRFGRNSNRWTELDSVACSFEFATKSLRTCSRIDRRRLRAKSGRAWVGRLELDMAETRDRPARMPRSALRSRRASRGPLPTFPAVLSANSPVTRARWAGRENRTHLPGPSTGARSRAASSRVTARTASSSPASRDPAPRSSRRARRDLPAAAGHAP